MAFYVKAEGIYTHLVREHYFCDGWGASNYESGPELRGSLSGSAGTWIRKGIENVRRDERYTFWGGLCGHGFGSGGSPLRIGVLPTES